MIIEANESVNPAVEALMVGVTRHNRPVTPMTAVESILMRIDSQRFTTKVNQQNVQERISQITPPHFQ